ncbi:MAG: thiamine phosphate synthase [Chloroflexota bacterium]|nr:MAG: thiamine phosphate synthase [Chloroflexota bacterium]
MTQLYRLIDANVNRVSEGVRVLEDLARLHFDQADLCTELRALRHAVRHGSEILTGRCLAARAAASDVGLDVSQSSQLDERPSLAALVAANFKRAQEGLRVIEETLKLAGRYDLSKEYEGLRFRAYTLEQRYAPLVRRERARAALDTDIYCITAEEYSLGRDNVQVVSEMLAAGVRLIQYRAKDKETGARYQECREIRRLTRAAGATFIVNDHPGLALMVEADGVHVGQDDYPIEAVRTLVGDEMIVGLSTHSPEQAQQAIRRGADYIGVGPVYRTFTKKNVTDPVGLEYVAYTAAHVSIPFVALGGVKVHNVAEVRRHGARCIALVTEIVGAPDIRERIEEIRAALKEGESQAV